MTPLLDAMRAEVKDFARTTTAAPSQEVLDHLYQESFGAPFEEVLNIALESVASAVLSDGVPRPVSEVTNMVSTWTMGALIMARAMKAVSG